MHDVCVTGAVSSGEGQCGPGVGPLILSSYLTYLITTLLSVRFRGMSVFPPVGLKARFPSFLCLWVIHNSCLRPNNVPPLLQGLTLVRSYITRPCWCMVKRKLCQVCRQHRPGFYRVCVRCHSRFGPSCLANCRWNRFLCRPCVRTILLYTFGDVGVVELILSFRTH